MTDYNPFLDDFLEAIGARFADESLDTYVLEYDGLEEARGDAAAKVSALAFVDDFPHRRGLFYYGPTGTGKTHLAIGIGLAVVKRMTPVRFVHMTTLLERQRGRLPSERIRPEHLFRRHKMLILDELGETKATSFSVDYTTMLIDAAWQAKIPVVITSNKDYHELHDMYGERAVSRLVDMATKVAVKGKDDRVARAKSR